ncbi:MAG: four helix bundle protein [Planctomycetota bacterium]|jgi:four helix bundle protein
MTEVRGSWDLEERLVSFASQIVHIVERFPRTLAGGHMARQLLRSGTGAAANYAEAQSAESRRDFIHKLKLALKELRETVMWLKVSAKSGISDTAEVRQALTEADRLAAILYTSITTATRNSAAKPR